MSKYAVGVDFGTLSARALIAEIGTGREVSTATMNYPHAVLDERLPDGTVLPPDWALQHPQDYIDCLKFVVPEAIRLAGIAPEDVVGVGVDFTSSTFLPTDAALNPLCLMPEYASRPHAYVKLWKHHGAQDEANRMTEIAQERGESFLARYGGKVSSEWMLPKIWEILNDDPEIYEKSARFIEGGDWIVAKLIGHEARSANMAGCKAFYQKGVGFPSDEFFAALDPRLEHLVDEKLSRDVIPVCSKAGELNEEGAALLSLPVGTAVGIAQLDAHVALPSAGITEPGKLLMIMGTSGCHITLDKDEHIVPGMCGVVEDGIVPGLMCYEAGQSCMGDHYNWFVDH